GPARLTASVVTTPGLSSIVCRGRLPDCSLMDIEAAVAFMTTQGRLLERRRLAALLGEGSAAGVLGALAGYRNADGGYGWGLEPDLRSFTSQPVAAMHALEVFAELPDTTGPDPLRLCD